MILIHYYKSLEFWILRKLGFITFGKIGKNTKIRYGFYSDTKNIRIGNYVYVGENCHLWALGGIVIGNGTILAPNVIIRSSNHDYKSGDFLPFGPNNELREVMIGDNCWVGANVLIAPGTTIGEGSIIGFGAVISGNIPPGSIVVGNPGKVIKKRDMEVYEEMKSQEKIYYKHF